MKGVLFDLWGTLAPVTTDAVRRDHFAALGRILGVDPTRFARAWAESLGSRCLGTLGSLEESILRVTRDVGPPPTPEALRRAVASRLDFTRAALTAGERLLPTLDVLRAQGVRLAIVSDATEEAPRVWPGLPIARRFEATVFSCESGFCKPDPRAYRRALDRLGLNASECVFVGDDGTPGELAGAERVGLRAFLFRFPPSSPDFGAAVPSPTAWEGPRLTDLESLLDLD